MRNQQWDRYRTLTVGLIASIFSLGMLYLLLGIRKSSSSNALPSSKELDEVESMPKQLETVESNLPSKTETEDSKHKEEEEATPSPPTTTSPPIHKQIEELDKSGRELFKAKNHIEAAAVFTEAIDLINSLPKTSLEKKQLQRQLLTLMNNRAAMYEKAGMIELALEDCDLILQLDMGHLKARTRKLRILENEKRYQEALIEVCALQLKFMQENREKLRLGIQVQPPVSQEKINELVQHIVPHEVDRQFEVVKSLKTRPLPANYTILQLFKSFGSFNSWMASAAKHGSFSALSKELENASGKERVVLLVKRGIRCAFDLRFMQMADDVNEAYEVVKDNEGIKKELSQEEYLRLLEWAGMCKHLKNELDEAKVCYSEYLELVPDSSEMQVKYAGVLMDSSEFDEALTTFNKALELNPNATDALLHRANLYLVKQDTDKAKKDLKKCINTRPDNCLLARLRLATIHLGTNDVESARNVLSKCDDDCSEVHSYRGEIHFAQGEMSDAKTEFELAIKYDPTNPSPYVNLALTMMNTIPVDGPPDIAEIMRLLSQAIKIDPHFHLAYVHLGQLKLSMAKDLQQAKEVISLYDDAIKYCRAKEELKDICNMRVLTVAQVDAANMMGMTTLS